MRNRSIAIVMVVAAAVLLSGCFEMKEELVLNADGSGTLTGKYVFGEQMTAMMSMGAAMGGAMESGDDSNLPMTAEDVKKMFKGPGIEVKEAKAETVEGKQNLTFKVAFKDVNELFKTKKYKDGKPVLSKNASGELVLEMGSEGMGKGLGVPEQEMPEDMTPELQEMMKQQQQAMMAMMEPMLKGLRMEFTIVMPNALTTTNAHKKEGRRATWVYDMDKLKELGALEGKMDENQMKMKAACSAKGVTLSLTP